MHGDLSTDSFVVNLAGEEYADRVYGCWQGKNAGGTLGAPLEETWGRDEPFDVWWYPELQEGGLPNDDLEMQLVWLKAVEEVGPGITARDLSRYWLDHIGYNFDEYGLSKRNLRLGMEPPVSGSFNNWFVDCMGSPIRSEVWACLAPGAPRIAARYAYQDAICDHAGGEGVHGEIFNTALESAAFVVQDLQLLIDIALSYLPADSQVRKAVEAARSAHAAGLDWKQARRKVLAATPHYNAQYAPINTGFQVIGLLYGEDFGDGICKTVNCGYDTDSSGAAVGSYLGILLGSRNLPEKWVAPLGNSIATNEDWGGVRHLADGSNPVPATLDELVVRMRTASERVLRHHGLLDRRGILTVALDELYADGDINGLLRRSPNAVPFPGDDLDVEVDYIDGPAAIPETTRYLCTTLTSKRRDPITLAAHLRTPAGWDDPAPQHVVVGAGDHITLTWEISVPAMPLVAPTNRLWLELAPVGYPVPSAVPVVLPGAVGSRLSVVFPAAGRGTDELLDTTFPPESAHGPLDQADSRLGPWRTAFAEGFAQPVGDVFTEPGVVYLQTFLHSPDLQDGFVIVDPSLPLRYWLNGVATGENREYRRIRPNQKAARGVGQPARLQAGWNELLVKLVHDGEHPSPELHLGFSDPGPLHTHVYAVDRSRFPWSSNE